MAEPHTRLGDHNRMEKEATAPPIGVLLESLLFVAQEPVPVERIASVLGVDPDTVEQGIAWLAEQYENRGLRLQRARGRIQMVTAPEAAEFVRRFLGLELRNTLSSAALETLAIVAYRQPATRAEIEAMRGVNSDGVLRTLINHGLVQPLGRLEQAGRPIIYGTTFEFLQHFGLSDVEELPPLQDLSNGEQPSP